MSFDQKAVAYANEILERRRLSAAEVSRGAKEKLYKSVPGLAEIDAAIAQSGIEQAKAALVGESALRANAAQRITELTRQRQQMLEQKGFVAADADQYHACLKCGDTGRLPNGRPCECFLHLVRDYSFKKINTRSPLSLSRFEDFSLEFYSNKLDEEFGLAPRRNMSIVLKECKAYALKFPNNKDNLLMAGQVGLGKTHLALSIANEAIQKGCDVLYCSAANIFKQIETEYFDGGHATATLDSLKRCDLLILDDLGSEFVNAFVAATIYDIVNTRLVNNKATVITTNFSDIRNLEIRYGEKVSSRLVGCYKTLAFFGEDIRLIKNEMQ